MPRYKMVNGERIQLTSQEEAQRDAEEKAWNDGAYDREMVSLRNRRNNLLQETDYFALSDVTMTDAMTTYRQELRDLPGTVADDATAADVDAVTFPTKP